MPPPRARSPFSREATSVILRGARSCRRSLPVTCKPPLADLVMTMNLNEPRHNHGHAFQFFNARQREGLVFAGRRGMLKAGWRGWPG